MMRGRGHVTIVQWISRQKVQANPNTIFVFGDNMERRGLGGQARATRGEPNTIGIPTKWWPGTREDAYFTDADADNPVVIQAIEDAFKAIRAALDEGLTVAFPASGIGTGLAELPTRAPRLYDLIQLKIDGLFS